MENFTKTKEILLERIDKENDSGKNKNYAEAYLKISDAEAKRESAETEKKKIETENRKLDLEEKKLETENRKLDIEQNRVDNEYDHYKIMEEIETKKINFEEKKLEFEKRKRKEDNIKYGVDTGLTLGSLCLSIWSGIKWGKTLLKYTYLYEKNDLIPSKQSSKAAFKFLSDKAFGWMIKK